MHCSQTLPENYRELLSIDLQKDKKTALLVNMAAVCAMVVLALIGLLLVPFRTLLDFSQGFGLYFLRLGVLLAGMFAYIVLHELTHAAVMKAYGAKKLRFGFTGMYAYAGSEADYFAKRPYRHIALAPLVLWALIFGLLSALVPQEWFWVVWILQIANVSGAAGDVYVTLRLLRLPRDLLVRDTGVAMTVYSAE
ncbi:MAG: DUF3267 domain-containing protein [Oscillospiraceae bacterium]|nr:DUF3267 domain-containing protein [Oscillospiraceae bacterium]